MGNYLSKVTPYRRPSFGTVDQSSNLVIGEEIKESNQADLIQEDEAVSLKNNNNSVTNGTTLNEDEQVNNENNDDSLNDHEEIDQKNGHTNGHSSVHTNGHSTDNLNNSQSDNVNDEDLNEKEFQNDALNDKINLKIKKDESKQYLNKKNNLITEELEREEEDDFEVVARGKKRGKRATISKKPYKKRKNNLINDLQRVNDVTVID